MKTLIKNAWIVTMDDDWNDYPEGFLLMEDTVIQDLGTMATYNDKYPDAFEEDIKVVDADGGLLIPGMINTHCHMGMIPFRGLGDDMEDRLFRLLLPLERSLTKELCCASSKMAIAEMLKSGITTVFDMYFYENDVVEVADEMGIRAFLGQTVQSSTSCENLDEVNFGMKLLPEFIEKWRNHELVKPAIAPHATYSVDLPILQEIARLAKENDILYSIHMSEMDQEMAEFKEKYRSTPVQYLAEQGVLNDHLIAVHCIHTNEKDIQVLDQYDVAVAHCVVANTKSAKGIAPIQKMIDGGVTVGLGTDGPSSGNILDMFNQMRTMAYAQKTANKNRSAFPAKDIFYLATRGGAKAVHLEDKVGQLSVGYQADMVLLETKSLNMFPVFDPYSTIVYQGKSENVQEVWVNGAHLIEDGQLTRVNQRDMMQEISAVMDDFVTTAKGMLTEV
ncbi:amidohydrolase [Aerococcus urinaeequi]|uniref:amidohydrolase n=1 Tax=Aerococcus urinaeequi TaxID=51665 RepID=UPI0022DFE060|nr:amidohydrolase [Aerococcus urinaeequi]